MCFFDTMKFKCGDTKWGPFRQHCSKEYRTGETCGRKIIMQTIHVNNKCRICDKIEVKLNRKIKEEDRIRRWKKEGKYRKPSIKASEEVIDGLSKDIAELMQERCDRANKLADLPICDRKDDGPGSKKPMKQNKVRDLVREPTEDEGAVLEDKALNKSRNIGSMKNHRTVVISNDGKKENSAGHKHTSGGISSRAANMHQSKRKGIDENIHITEDRKCTSTLANNSLEIAMHEKFKLSPICVVDLGKEVPWNQTRNLFPKITSGIPSVDVPALEDHVACLALDGTIDSIPRKTKMRLERLSTVGNDFRKELLHWQPNSNKTLTSSAADRESRLGVTSSKSKNSLLKIEDPSHGGATKISSTSLDKGIIHMGVGLMTTIPKNEDFAKDSVSSFLVKSQIPRAYEATPVLPMESDELNPKLMPGYTRILEMVLLLTRQAISDYLVQEFNILFDQAWSANLKECGEGSSSSSRSDGASENILESNTSGASAEGKKRGRDYLEEDDPNQNGTDKRQKHKSHPEGTSLRLACPFFKRDPEKFGIGTPRHVCAGQGWKDLAKLKEHLYRKHHFSFQCQRCKIALASQAELNEHVEAFVPCQSRYRQLKDGFDHENFLFLKRKTPRGQTEAEWWKEIFSRLFPDYPIPSPYLTHGICDGEAKNLSELEELEDFEAYQQREVPAEFARLATVEALRSSRPILRHLVSQVPNMTRDAHETVSRGYESNLFRCQQEDSNAIHDSSLTSSPGASLQVQSPVWPVPDQNNLRTTNNNPLLNQSLRLREAEESRPLVNMQSSDSLNNEFGLNGNWTCFCMGPCTCFIASPLSFHAESFNGEHDPFVLQILQNISSRLAKLERQSAISISPSNLSQPALIDLASMRCNSTATERIRGPLSSLDTLEIPQGPATSLESTIEQSAEEDKNGFDLVMSDFEIPID